MSSTVMIRGETQTVIATNHMLGDIVCLLVCHLDSTFSVGDHHDSHGRYAVLASCSKKQNEHDFFMTRQTNKADRARKYAHFVAWDG